MSMPRSSLFSRQSRSSCTSPSMRRRRSRANCIPKSRATSRSRRSAWKVRASARLRFSTRSRWRRSVSANSSASRIMRCTSPSSMLEAPCTIRLCSRPVVLSIADTWRMPLASISKDTSTWGTPRGAGGMPISLNRPRDLLLAAISRSPWSTCTSTEVWLFSEVEKISDRRTGMVVLRGITFFITPPMVSRPKDREETSSSMMSCTSWVMMPACTAAPTATASSGLTAWLGSRPISDRTKSCTMGMRLPPPTSTTSSMSLGVRPASLRACLRGARNPLTRSPQRPSNCDRLRRVSMCLGPSGVAVIKGRLISVLATPDSSILAFSAASVSRWRAWRSLRRSMPSVSRN